MTTEKHILKIEKILNLLPHRYPFLLIDRIINFRKNQYLKAIKNISVNEPCFQGHYPGKPIFPGVLILEAMAQATGVLTFKSIEKIKQKKNYYFAGINDVRFKKPVIPGDQMIIEVNFEKTRKNFSRFKGIATVKNKIVCKAVMLMYARIL